MLLGMIEAVVIKELRKEFLLDLNSHPITEKQTHGLGMASVPLEWSNGHSQPT
jgi:hypothetical protein